jgi:hypothetical protein
MACYNFLAAIKVELLRVFRVMSCNLKGRIFLNLKQFRRRNLIWVVQEEQKEKSFWLFRGCEQEEQKEKFLVVQEL